MATASVNRVRLFYELNGTGGRPSAIGAQVVILTDAGNIPHLMDPDSYAETIIDFMGRETL